MSQNQIVSDFELNYWGIFGFEIKQSLQILKHKAYFSLSKKRVTKFIMQYLKKRFS